ncbi:MAG TPA: ATP-binding protein [Vicinamibacterales bacterium]|nr:ATP-binding protein [Vicinamibacterales bacterium]
MSKGNRLWHLASAVARTDRMADLLPLFHQLLLRAVGGQSSVLLRLNPRTGHLQADSAAGLDVLGPEPWLADDESQAAAERSWAKVTPVTLRGIADLTERLNAPIAVLAPLVARDRRLGLVIIGIDDDSALAAHRDELTAIADLLALALERARSRRLADLQQDLRELSVNLTRAVSSSLHLGAALEVFCDRAARLFAADRVSVWLHNRRARVLELTASSDAAELAAAPRVGIDDQSVPVAAAMRRDEAHVPAHSGDRPADVLAPLRGRRRALGVLEFTGVRIETGDAVDLLERVDEVARHLSAAIENVFLFEDVLRSRRELESTFNSLTDLVIVTDQGLRITQANLAFATRVQRQPRDLTERLLGEFVDRDVIAWVERRISGEAPAEFERELVDSKLNGTFLFTASPLVGGDDEPIGTVIVARDVTAQARLAAEQTELRSRLTQSEKLAALGQFVAGIAHELNNPLQGVLGHVELMLQHTNPPNRFRRDLKLVFREADRAAKIVHNLLVFAGSRRITRRRLNVNHVVEKVLHLRATACAAASIAVEKNLTPKLPRVSGDALLLQQALLNIVVNAEQAMAHGKDPRRLDVTTRPIARGRLEIVVADTGPGISSHALPRLFEPFFTTKDVGQGTGLGLAIAYGIVQEHGGRLDAVNRADGGATFTITLPAGSSDAVE